MCGAGCLSRHRLRRYHGTGFGGPGRGEEFCCGLAPGFGGGGAVVADQFEGLGGGWLGGGLRAAGPAAVEAVHPVQDGGHQRVLGGVEELADGDAQVAGDVLDPERWVNEAGDQVARVEAVGEAGLGCGSRRSGRRLLRRRHHGNSCSPWGRAEQGDFWGWGGGVRAG